MDVAGSVSNPRAARRLTDVLAVMIGLADLVVCGLAARSGRVGPLEARVFHEVNGLPDLLTAPMRVAQYLGVLVVGPLVALAALACRRYRLAIAALLVTAAKLAAERLVWQVVTRSRPGTSIADAIVRAGTPTSGQSFVSGHVVLVTGLAWVAAPYLPRGWRVVPWVVVGLVAFARVYLGAHAPLDVVGGLGLGAAIGGAVDLVLSLVPVRTRGTAGAAVPTG